MHGRGEGGEGGAKSFYAERATVGLLVVFHPLEIAEWLAMQNEKHLEIPHVTRPSSHSFLAEFLLIVV